MTKLTGKNVVITGATQGLGRQTALLFAQEQANLILLGRNFSALEQLDNELSQFNIQTTLIPLDLNELDKIPQLGHHLRQRYNSIDILVMNAAMLGSLSPLTHQVFHTWQQVFNVNLHANWLLLQTLEPMLSVAQAPNIIGVTTGILNKYLPYWGAYATSKAAFEHMLMMYAQEKKSLGFKVNCLDPGIMRTKLYAEAMPGADLDNIPLPLAAAQAILKACCSDKLTSGTVFKIDDLKSL